MAEQTLPEELLALIFEQLVVTNEFDTTAFTAVKSMSQARKHLQEFQKRTEARQQGVSTLLNVCLASKSLHRLAWPNLYRHFCSHRDYGEDEEDESDENESNEDEKESESGQEYGSSKFLRSICLRPDYGLALQSLEIQGWPPVEAMDGKELFDLLQGDATVSALFQWRARGFWLEGNDSTVLVERLHRTLGLGLEDGLVTLLLLMCPNIRKLDLTPCLDFGESALACLLDLACDQEFLTKPLPEPDHDIEQEEADYVIAQMFGTPWPKQKLSKPLVLQKLERLTIRGPGISNFRRFGALLTLPSLHTLGAHSFRGNMGASYPAKEVLLRYGKSPKLRSLALPHCSAESKEIAELVELCPELRDLSVVWQDFHMTAMSENNMDERWTLKYGDIAEAATNHTPKLELLDLNASNGWPNHDAVPKHPFVVGSSLVGMQNLVELRLDDHAIYGSQYGTFGNSLRSSVPHSVVSLTLYSEDPYDRRGLPNTVAWLKYQDADLRAFLEDDTFTNLSSIHLSGRVREVFVVEELKHNWRPVAPLSSRVKRDNPETLVNHEHLNDLGIQLLSKVLPYFGNPALFDEYSSSDEDGEEDDDFGGTFFNPADEDGVDFD